MTGNKEDRGEYAGPGFEGPKYEAAIAQAAINLGIIQPAVDAIADGSSGVSSIQKSIDGLIERGEANPYETIEAE